MLGLLKAFHTAMCGILKDEAFYTNDISLPLFLFGAFACADHI